MQKGILSKYYHQKLSNFLKNNLQEKKLLKKKSICIPPIKGIGLECFFLAIFGISKIRNFSEILYLYLMIIQYTIKLKVISIKKLVRDTLKN